ncbi:MAG: glycosyltransferase family 2 protein [Terriglobia bacterium]|jgi:glycosyltransferase involved in cell wall biosynthesis
MLAKSMRFKQPTVGPPSAPQGLTILMPAHNEEDIIAAAVTEWHAEVINKVPGSRLLVIDDASTDGTPGVLDQLTRTLPGFAFISREVNGGHGKALRFGFRQVNSEFVFQTDSDRQHCPADFWRLWDLRNQFDFVFGVRKKRQDGAFRKLVTTLMRVLNWLLWQVWISDANCPFKLMRTGALATVLKRVPEDAFIPMVMVSILARRMRFRVVEVSVEHLPRLGGTQSLRGLARWARVGLLCARQLARLRFGP